MTQASVVFLSENFGRKCAGASRELCVCRCVLGNCFSVQKDHESALKFFKRSLQACMDPWVGGWVLGWVFGCLGGWVSVGVGAWVGA